MLEKRVGLLIWRSLAIVSLVSVTQFADAHIAQPQQKAVPGQYVVQLKAPRATFGAQALERSLGGKIIDTIRPDMIVIQRSDLGMEATMVAEQISKLPQVEIAEPNFLFHALTAPNDPDYSKLWGLNNTGVTDKDGKAGIAGIDIGVEKAWEFSKGSKDVVIAIIDTGVNYKHPELANNIWTNQAEANGKAGVDDDANGYIDDIHGFNVKENTGDPMDDNGHGSHCAGVIGAEGNNGIGIAGINWHTSIMAVKFLDASGGGNLEDAVKALDYARKNHAQILSNSWGGSVVSEILQKAVADTRDAGELFVAAAGNDGIDNDSGNGGVPASYQIENVVAVAAVDNRGQLADFSNYGAKTVAVAAPGVNIYSTFLNDGYETLSGTSMAAPHVAGLAALMMANQPSLTYQEIKKRLISSSRPFAGLNGKVAANGIINAGYALSGETPPLDPNDPSLWSDRIAYKAETVHPYPSNANQTITIQQPGAKKLAVHFLKFETEAAYDKVEFFDSKGVSQGVMSGKQTGRYGPVVLGDTIVLKFTSDASVNGYGFDIDYVSLMK